MLAFLIIFLIMEKRNLSDPEKKKGILKYVQIILKKICLNINLLILNKLKILNLNLYIFKLFSLIVSFSNDNAGNLFQDGNLVILIIF